ncbi:MAG: hypothetical protein RLZZ524_2042 [Pseudomonadota bacterium]|jgi:hypothetical protein
MNPELVIASMLQAPGIAALVGDRIALGTLPTNTALPAVVYQVVDATPMPNVAYQNGPKHARARIQINPLAHNLGDVKAIHAAIRHAIDFAHHQTHAGKLVISCRFALLGPVDRDHESDTWTQPADYNLTYDE